MTNLLMENSELLSVKRIYAVDVTCGDVIWKTDKVYPQHFYPLSIKDYCYAIKEASLRGLKSLPILSISSKDFPYCDFKCIDCLACTSREWALNGKNIQYPIIPIEMYKNVLQEISRYSAIRGCEHVRFEICGEGNPDLYREREEMLQFAHEQCGMGIVYVSTGSKLNERLIDTLVETASFIRISFPGLNGQAYMYYSNQCRTNVFSYDSAVQLVKKLSEKRRALNREKELMIGTRTCIRPLNAGSYKEFIKTVAGMGVDAFQAVKVLTPEFEKHEDEGVSEDVIEELLTLRETYKTYGLKNFQIPGHLNSVYNDRSLDKTRKPSRCWSSLVSPLLYGTNMISCAHWDKITNFDYHYGVLEGKFGELENIMWGENAKYIMENCPRKCSDCCSYNDNDFMDALWKALRTYNQPENIHFFFER